MLPYMTVATLHWYLAAHWRQWPRWRSVVNLAIEVCALVTKIKAHSVCLMPALRLQALLQGQKQKRCALLLLRCFGVFTQRGTGGPDQERENMHAATVDFLRATRCQYL